MACPMSSVRNLHTPIHCKKEKATNPLSGHSISCLMSSVRNHHTPVHCKKDKVTPLSNLSIACPMSRVRNLHTPTHCKTESTSSHNYSSQSLHNGLSLPSPYHQHPPAPFTSITEHPSKTSSLQSVCGVTDKSLSYGQSSSNLSHSNPEGKVSHVSSLDFHPQSSSHVMLESHCVGSWHPQVIPSPVSGYPSCQVVNNSVVSDASEPWEQCSNNSKASHINPIYHSLEPNLYKHISHSIKSLEYSKGEQSCDPESCNGVNISSTLNCKPHFARRKSKRREEKEGTTADWKTTVHLLRPSNVR